MPSILKPRSSQSGFSSRSSKPGAIGCHLTGTGQSAPYRPPGDLLFARYLAAVAAGCSTAERLRLLEGIDP